MQYLIVKQETKAKKYYTENEVIRMLDFLIKYIVVLLVRGMIHFIQETDRVFVLQAI